MAFSIYYTRLIDVMLTVVKGHILKSFSNSTIAIIMDALMRLYFLN